MRVCVLDPVGHGLKNMMAWLAEMRDVEEVQSIQSQAAFLQKVAAERPDLVFIRLINSGISGLKTAQAVKKMDPAIRIVLVAEEKVYALQAYEVGAFGYLRYPVERNKFDQIFV